MDATQLRALSATQLATLGRDKGVGVPPTELSATQLAALTPTDLDGIGRGDASALTARQLAALRQTAPEEPKVVEIEGLATSELGRLAATSLPGRSGKR